MSYTQPNTITDGTEIDGSDLKENYRDARLSLHKLDVADIANDAIETRHIVKFDRVFGDHYQMTSGVLIFKSTGPNLADRDFITSHIKQANFESKSTLVDVPQAGASFYLEKSAALIITFSAFAFGFANDELPDNGYANRIYCYVDDFRAGETISYVADIDGSDATGDPGHTGANLCRWTPLQFMCADTLTAGWHTVQIKCDPYMEFMEICNIKLLIRATYNA